MVVISRCRASETRIGEIVGVSLPVAGRQNSAAFFPISTMANLLALNFLSRPLKALSRKFMVIMQ
jgi:hypothetical protein